MTTTWINNKVWYINYDPIWDYYGESQCSIQYWWAHPGARSHLDLKIEDSNCITPPVCVELFQEKGLQNCMTLSVCVELFQERGLQIALPCQCVWSYFRKEVYKLYDPLCVIIRKGGGCYLKIVWPSVALFRRVSQIVFDLSVYWSMVCSLIWFAFLQLNFWHVFFSFKGQISIFWHRQFLCFVTIYCYQNLWPHEGLWLSLNFFT